MEASREEMLREAQALERLGLTGEAILAYQRLLKHWPTLAVSWFNLGVLQRKARQLEAALESYQRALDHGISRPEEVHLNRAVIYADYLRQDTAAERELQAAIALNPGYEPALLNLGNLYEDLGRRADALEVYQRILARYPNSPEALARYANVQPLPTPDDSLTQRLYEAIAVPGAAPAAHAALGFALGRLLDGNQEYAAAFSAYAMANRASRASTVPPARYDRVRMEQLIERLISIPVVPAAGADSTRRTPIFICGMFRSGSTLCEQLLAGHPQVRAGGELDLLPRLVAGPLAPFPDSMLRVTALQVQALAGFYLDELARVFPDATWVTDKRPDNFLYLGLIKSLFPQARIVHTVRDALDNCLSVFFLHLDQSMSYALDLMDIAHYYRQYRRLMDHWKSLFGADILDFSYDEFVHHPVPASQALFGHLGLPWEERVLSHRQSVRHAIKTASVWQVREPLYQRSSGRAAHYAQQLEGVRAYLADLVH